jgi:hypothetical protein
MSQTNTSDALSFIARTFAGAYYGLLVDAENFSKLHTFYQLDAVFTRGDEATGQDDASTTTGLEGIKKELATFHNQVRNSEVTLKVMDSQYSVNQGIVITAVGSFNRLEGAAVKTRRFVQTFFLEAQTPNNYSIRNDILRYLNETSQQVVVAAKEEPKPQPTASAPTTTSVNGTATETHTTASAVESNGDAKKQSQDKKKPAAGSPTPGRKVRPNRKGEDKKSRETKPEQGQEQPAAAKPSKPTTYATIVSGNAAPSAPVAPAKPKTAVSAAPKKQAAPQEGQNQQQQQQQQQQAKPLKEKKPTQEREGHSVYVGNLPFVATSDQVYNLFAKFVTIKDVALKRGYGFVDLTSAEDLKKVIDHFAEHPVELAGRLLVIEDRKRGGPAKSSAPRAQGQSQPKPAGAGAKRPKTSNGNKSNDNAAH